MSPTNWKHDSRGSCLHQVLPLVTGDLFRVLLVTPSGVKLLTLHHLGDQHVTYWKKLACGIYILSHVNKLTPPQKKNNLPIFRYRKTSQTPKQEGNTTKTYPKTTKNNQPPPKTIPHISSTLIKQTLPLAFCDICTWVPRTLSQATHAGSRRMDSNSSCNT